MASIYGLYDGAGGLRYIGKANDPEKRLKGHMRDARRRRTPLYDWIAKHGRPEMRVLVADCLDWKAEERRLINEARARGERLLNLADGGDEPMCSRETRAKNGAKVAKAIHSDPARARLWHLKRTMGDLLKRGHVSEETRAKLRQLAVRNPSQFGSWVDI